MSVESALALLLLGVVALCAAVSEAAPGALPGGGAAAPGEEEQGEPGLERERMLGEYLSTTQRSQNLPVVAEMGSQLPKMVTVQPDNSFLVFTGIV